MNEVKLTKKEQELVNIFIANELILAEYLKKVLSQKERNKKVLKEKLMFHLSPENSSGTSLIPYGRQGQAEFRKELRQAIESVDDKEFTKFIQAQFAFPYTPLDKINLIIYTESIVASQGYARIMEKGWSEIIGRTLKGVEDKNKIRDIILLLKWADGRDILTFKEMLLLNGYRVGQSMTKEITRNIVGGTKLSTIDTIINKRHRIQENDLKRIVETSSTFYTNNSFYWWFSVLYGINLWRHVSVLDERTTELCWSRHGKVWETKELVQGITIPPLHYHCRSILVPVI